MKNRTLVLSFLIFGLTQISYAQKPIVQTSFTADPAPMVYDDTVFLFTSHDEDSTMNNFFTMFDWRCYSSTDMVNWTDRGTVASLKNFAWCTRTNGAWAPQCLARNGKFYLYVPIHGEGISVLVSDSPLGPYIDVLGKRLINSNNIWQDIDPTIFVDDNGQAYLYWGNPQLWYVKLNKDMVSYNQLIGENGIVSVEMTAEAFGSQVGMDGKLRTTYTEGPWFYKRNNWYYIVYAAAGIPECIAYSMAPSAEGPWTFKGNVMERSPQLAFTNHAGIIDFKGKSYFFYHSESLIGGGGFRRSVCVEPFSYNADGSIPLIAPTPQGVTESVAPINPFSRVQAETMSWSEGLKTEVDDKSGVYMTKIDDGDFLEVRSVDFGNGANRYDACIASIAGGKIEIHLDNKDGDLIGTMEVKKTDDKLSWEPQTCKIKSIQGIHDLFFIFKGNDKELFNFDWWQLYSE